MHHLIRFVIEAKDADDALAKAEEQLNDMIERNEGYIDYGTFYEDEGVNGHSVKNWGNDKAAYRFDEEKGRELVMQGLMFGYTDFLDRLEEVKKIIAEQTPQEIYGNSMTKYSFRRIDNDQWVVFESEFVNATELRSIIDNKNAKDLWVVPCDVHT